MYHVLVGFGVILGTDRLTNDLTPKHKPFEVTRLKGVSVPKGNSNSSSPLKWSPIPVVT